MPSAPQSPRLCVALLQLNCGIDPEKNLRNAIQRIGVAARRGAKLICLPELFRSRYFCQKEDYANFDLAETIPGPTTKVLGRVARTHKITLVASLFEKRTGGLYHNTAVVLGPNGKIIGTYRKMHIPDDPGFSEKFYFAPGDTGFKPIDTPVGKLGVLVCWDQWYPEAARLMALRGAEILIYPTAIGWARGEKKSVCEAQRNAWQTIQRSHAIANGVFVLSINRTGWEDDLNFWGTSFVSDPFGGVTASASVANPDNVITDLDLADVSTTRQHWPFLRDRRIDAYGGLDQRFLTS
ncbi:MAG: carbon-nitrogen hydrolase [Verrucomicrobia bacterium]|nr:carbon-nitrogen hydrolase [Verrucomicrobiota bacterium]